MVNLGNLLIRFILTNCELSTQKVDLFGISTHLIPLEVKTAIPT
jgi:hypothetical protein